MRKVIAALLFAALMAVCLAACAQSRQTNGEPEQIPPQAAFDITPTPNQDSDHQKDVGSEPEAVVRPDMSISSAGVKDGFLEDRFGMRGSDKSNGVPTLSPPVSITDAPQDTVCFAVIMIDPDSKPLCGYEWVHWLAVGIPSPDIEENASINSSADICQGKNDFGTIGYGGPTPPDKPHTYIITVYALDGTPGLAGGFSLSELKDAMEGHILAEASLSAVYNN